MVAIFCGVVASFFTPSIAQISVVFPTPQTVIQRNNSNQAQLWMLGQCPPNATRIEVAWFATAPGFGAGSAGYVMLDGSPQNGRFRGQVTLQGGWYTLSIRAMQDGNILETTAVTPVGVGEVFAVAGQSNGQGVLPNRNTVPSYDGRVVTVPHYNVNDTIRLPLPPTFERISTEGIIGPRGLTSWCWGVLGDSLAKRLNVPIAFYNTAWSGTAIRNWRESITQDSTATAWGEYFRPKMPYTNLKRVLQDYVSLTGVRAVLWHQGEAEYYDTDPTAANYYDDLRFVIARSRADAGYSQLAWMVARASIDMYTRSLYPSQRYEPVWNAQTHVIQTTDRVFFGPDTDPLGIPRPDGVHLDGTGLIEVANAWNMSMNPDFFNAAVPLLPQPPAYSTDLALSGSITNRVVSVGQDVLVTLTLTNTGAQAASGIRVRCQLPSNLVCVNPGLFTLRNGQLLATVAGTLTPGGVTTLPFVVRAGANGTYRVAAEIIRSDQLDEDSRANTSFADGQDDMTWIDFRTIEPNGAVFSSPISINAVVLPPVASNQPLPNPTMADLSLRVVSDRLATSVGQPIRVSAVVTNRGGSAATNVQVQYVLPFGTGSFSSPNMTQSGQTALGTITSIPAGESASLWFEMIGTGAGMPLFKAQLVSATPADPNSAMNNGYDTGEDDTAQVAVRVW